MRKLVLILIGFIAVITFIRALDYTNLNYSSEIHVNVPGVVEQNDFRK